MRAKKVVRDRTAGSGFSPGKAPLLAPRGARVRRVCEAGRV